MTTVTRTLTVPIIKPLQGRTWDELGDAIRARWQESTEAANVVISELYAADMRAKETVGELPDMTKINTYQKIVALVPDMPSGSASAIDRIVRRKYTSKNSKGHRVRWAAITGTASLPSFRYPMPYPIRAQDWKIAEIDGDIVVDLPLGRITKGKLDRFICVLPSTGRKWARPGRILRQIVAGEINARDIKIVEMRGDGKNKPGVAIAYDMPVVEKDRSGSLNVRTDGESLVIANVEGDDRIWKYHNDRLPSLIAAHRRRLARWSDDRKFEDRSTRQSVTKHSRKRVDKQSDIVGDALHQASARIVGFADRRNVAEIIYDDTDQSWCESLPYHRLKTLIKEKAEQKGIVLRESK